VILLDLALEDVRETDILPPPTALDCGSTEPNHAPATRLDGSSSIDHPQNANVLQASPSSSCTRFKNLHADETAETLSNDGDSTWQKDSEICVLPTLPPRFPRKFSIFGACTVIHRRKTRPRAWISNTDGPQPLTPFSRSDNITQGSTDQSTCISTVFSQASRSSSLDGVSTSLLTMSESPNGVQVPQFLSSQRCSPPQSVPQFKLQPSIVTVEATAAAKIFLETHFNAILSGRDARGQRHRGLQEHLCTLPFTHEERKAAKQAWVAQETEYLRQTRVMKSYSNRFNHKETISAAGYETVKLLGQGSFGVVRLVKEKGSVDTAPVSRKEVNLDVDGIRDGPSLWLMPKSKRPANSHAVKNERKDVYAMKIIRKADMIQLCQEGHIRAEREFLTSSEQSKWIVPLIASFQDTSHLYLIMEYEVGGDFFGLLLRHGVLSERDTVWYVAEMVLCIEEAHRLGWIHRDVKPENFLISSSGHLKIGDFGLAFDGHWSHNQEYFHNHRYSLLDKLGIEVEGDAKDQSNEHGSANSMNYVHHCGDRPPGLKPGERVLDWRDRNEQRRLARSIVGTSQYMAPEIIAGEAYDGRCDYWSIGIILFEVC
jgi:tRNA A-37 threonylcarbamoyl transferase component Bud32